MACRLKKRKDYASLKFIMGQDTDQIVWQGLILGNNGVISDW